MDAAQVWTDACLDRICGKPGHDPVSLTLLELARDLPGALRVSVERRARQLAGYLRQPRDARVAASVQARLDSFHESPPHPSLIAVAPLIRLHDWNDPKWAKRRSLPRIRFGWPREAADWLADVVGQLECAALIPGSSGGTYADALERLLRAVANRPPRRDCHDDVRRLPLREVRKLLQLIVDHWSRGLCAREVGAELLRPIAALRPEALRGFHERLAEIGVVHPGFIYRFAGARARDLLIGQAERIAETDHLLKSLAFIGDDVVAARFASWDRKRPHWRSKIHVKPSRYAEEGGWELDSQRARRLVPQACWHLLPDERGPLHSTIVSDVRCHHCQNPLTIILELPASRFRSLALPLAHVPFAWCHPCYGTTFTALRDDSGFRLLRASTKLMESPYQPLAAQRFAEVIAASPLAPLVQDGSFVGGHPNWRDDAFFPRCPRCRTRMPSVAQVDGDAGMTYLFLCRACRITAVSAQCT